MNLNRNTKIGLGFAIFIIGSAFWWAGVTTSELSHVREAVMPIPEMQQDIATIKAVLTANPLAQD